MAKTNKKTPRSSTKKKTNDPNSRIEAFLQYFEQEIPDVREELANTIPAYNMLLSLNAKSFEELPLMAIAKERGISCISRFSYMDVKPVYKLYPNQSRFGVLGYLLRRRSRLCHE